MPILERILTMGILGSGKSYQWLMMARILKPTGAIFRCLDTDNSIRYMLQTQFQDLLPENGGNVIVHNVFDWPEYKLGVDWLLRKSIKPEVLKTMNPAISEDIKKPLLTKDWTVVDLADMAWRTVQRYFIEEVFGEEMGDYFLMVRKGIEEGKIKTKQGKMPASVATEVFDGWKDWPVMNRLYDDWMLPIVYRIPTQVYVATKVEEIFKTDKDPEMLEVFGPYGIHPAGQKALGHQMHSVFLLIPGKGEWKITTIKDRGGRTYFNRVKLTSFYYQYLVAKAGWPVL